MFSSRTLPSRALESPLKYASGVFNRGCVLSCCLLSLFVSCFTPAQGQNLSPLSSTPDWEALEPRARQVTAEQILPIFNSLYTSTDEARGLIRITPDALEVLTNSNQPELARFPFAQSSKDQGTPVRYWRRVHELPPLKGRPVLSDLVIAIDPGHLGGSWSQMEERHFTLEDGRIVKEGDLVLEVAKKLRQKLESQGAKVYLTRENSEPVTQLRPESLTTQARNLILASGIPNPPDQYDGPLDPQRIISVKWQSEKLFYRTAEILARAEKINDQIRPDLVLCLHLNAEAWGQPGSPVWSPVNHFHLLVNGNYSREELLKDDVRFEMLLRLLEGTHEEEIPLAKMAAKEFAKITQLPPYLYTTSNATQVSRDQYVWARNLAANRQFRCPVLYYEPFVMNHRETAIRLLAGDYQGKTLLDGKLLPSALREYIDGVTQGLISYYQQHRK